MSTKCGPRRLSWRAESARSGGDPSHGSAAGADTALFADGHQEQPALPDGFLFLFVFDFFSVLERKNPLGLIDAFARAFRAGEGPTLVIKTINGDRKLHDLEKLRAAAEGRQDILVIDDYYSAEEKNSLLGLCDCYVSLHRSEGLGLTMAEAMGLEKPVIATGYSGNLDFMTAGEQLSRRLHDGCRPRRLRIRIRKAVPGLNQTLTTPLSSCAASTKHRKTRLARRRRHARIS